MKRSWPALILSPLFALASVSLGYALVTPACSAGRTWLVHASSILFLALAAASTALAWSALRTARREFLPLVSAWSGTFFTAVIVLQWIAVFIVAPCMHSP